MPRISIVPFNHHRSALANNVPLRRQNLAKCTPIIRVKHCTFQVFHFVIFLQNATSRQTQLPYPRKSMYYDRVKYNMKAHHF
jgi:hypothetical protein